MTTTGLNAAYVRDFLEQRQTFDDVFASSQQCKTIIGGDRLRATIAVAILYMAGERQFRRVNSKENSFGWRLAMFYLKPPSATAEKSDLFRQREMIDKICAASRTLGLHATTGGRITLTHQPVLEQLMQEPRLLARAHELYRDARQRWEPYTAIVALEGIVSAHPPVTLADIKDALERVIKLVEIYERQHTELET